MSQPLRPPILQDLQRRKVEQCHAPNPLQAHVTKTRIDEGYSLGSGLPAGTQRRYFCRNCGEEQECVDVPHGWLSLRRHFVDGDQNQVAHRLGLYCCLECLVEQMPRLIGIAEQLGGNWVKETEKYR
jgi:hypothetical protein